MAWFKEGEATKTGNSFVALRRSYETGKDASGRESLRRILGRAQDDGIGDRYRLRRKLAEPARCPVCGAVYHEGRWQWMELPPAGAELCQACHRINDKYPAGVVTLGGPAVGKHEEEIVNLARNLEQAEKQEHP